MSADFPRRWVLASGNQGKLHELRTLLAPLQLELISQDQVGVVQAPEVGRTFLENALAKARIAATQSGLPAIADDSGLAVDALRGRPGIHSARYAGDHASDADNVEKLLGALAGKPETERGACFHCVLVALEHADEPAPIVVHGRWRGRISSTARGQGGFGYDPVFIGQGLDRTAAELAADQKNRISHRGRALAELLAALKEAR